MMKKTIHTIIVLLAFTVSVFAQDVMLKIEDVDLDPNDQTVEIPILVEGFTDIAAVQFTLHWDPSVLTFNEVSAYSLPDMEEGNFGTNNAANGELTFYYEDQTTLGQDVADGNSIFTLKMNVVGAIHSFTMMEFVNDPTPIEVGNSSGAQLSHQVVNGKITIGGMVSSTDYLNGSGQVRIAPNPFKDRTFVEFDLPSNSKTSMNIYNVEGQLIIAKEMDLASGTHAIPVDGRDLPAAGTYYIKISTTDLTDYRQLIYVK